MSKISVQNCVLTASQEEMVASGYRMIGVMHWVTAGGTVLSYAADGLLTIDGSLPSGLQSFFDAGGLLPADPEVKVSGNSLDAHVYRDYLQSMANLPRHPEPWDKNYNEQHAAHHAAKEAVYLAWDAARDAVHGRGPES